MITGYIVIVTKMGKVIKASADQFPEQTRGGQGIKGVTIKQGDEVVSSFFVPGNEA